MSALSPNDKGFIGEANIYNIVNSFNFWFKGGKVLKNLYVPKENGETTEIDLIYITKKGVFVFESKNYSGVVKGDKDDILWSVKYKNGTVYSFYNPIKQNDTHIRCLRSIIGDSVPIFSVVVFSSEATLYLPEKFNFNLYVVLLYRLKNLLKSVWKRSRTILSKKQVKDILKNLYPMTMVSSDIRKQHIENIRKKYYESDINIDFPDLKSKYNILSNVDYNKEGKLIDKGRRICPYCGKALVLKTATKGNNIGSQFYGCIDWPNCNYTEDLKGYRKYKGYSRKKRW